MSDEEATKALQEALARFHDVATATLAPMPARDEVGADLFNAVESTTFFALHTIAMNLRGVAAAIEYQRLSCREAIASSRDAR